MFDGRRYIITIENKINETVCLFLVYVSFLFNKTYLDCFFFGKFCFTFGFLDIYRFRIFKNPLCTFFDGHFTALVVNLVYAEEILDISARISILSRV